MRCFLLLVKIIFEWSVNLCNQGDPANLLLSPGETWDPIGIPNYLSQVRPLAGSALAPPASRTSQSKRHNIQAVEPVKRSSF